MILPSQQGAQPRVAELDYGLKSTFLERLDEDLKLRIFDLTARMARELHRWAAHFPLIRRVRVWPLSLSIAAATPFASVQALVSAARISLWVFTIDDLFDEEHVPISELQRRVARYNDILAGGDPADAQRDSLAQALQDIRNDLQGYPLYAALHEKWANAISGTLDGMMQEYVWRSDYSMGSNTAALPSYASYLGSGLYSSGVSSHFWTTLIVLGDESVLDHLDYLTELEHTAALSIRLANDLQSQAKEIAEGKINSIVIRQNEAIAQGYDAETALQRACEAAQAEIRHGLARLEELERQSHTTTGYPERAICDIARFVCDFYIHHDYHTFTIGTGKQA